MKSAPFLKIAFAIAVLGIYGAVTTGMAVWAISAHTPCTSNFEGGCGYGKAWAGALAWLASWMGLGAAGGVAGLAAVFPSARHRFMAAGAVLAAPPAAYFAYGLYELAAWAL